MSETEYEFLDTKNGRTFRFHGERLAFETTEDPARPVSKPRWSEIHIFITPGDQYVLVKRGCSLVYHGSRDCGRGGQHHTEMTVATMAEKHDIRIPCRKCDAGLKTYEDYVYLENDLTTVTTTPSARGLVESAHVVDADEVLFLPNMAQRALVTAAEKDTKIREAFAVQIID